MNDLRPPRHPRRTVVLLHGYACSSRDWDLTAQPLQEDYTVFMPDFPGHGACMADRARTMGDLTAYTQGYLRRSCETPPVLVGHSMGGMVAMALCAQTPAAVEGLVLVDCFPHLPTAVAVLGGPDDPADPFGFGSVMDRQTPVAVQQRVRHSMTAGVGPAGEELFQSLLDADLRPNLSMVRAPSLLLLGDRRRITDASAPSVAAQLGYGLLANLTIRTVPSHHFAMLERPDLVALYIRDFVMSLFNERGNNAVQ